MINKRWGECINVIDDGILRFHKIGFVTVCWRKSAKLIEWTVITGLVLIIVTKNEILGALVPIHADVTCVVQYWTRPQRDHGPIR